jgi:hypothetical protein
VFLKCYLEVACGFIFWFTVMSSGRLERYNCMLNIDTCSLKCQLSWTDLNQNWDKMTGEFSDNSPELYYTIWNSAIFVVFLSSSRLMLEMCLEIGHEIYLFLFPLRPKILILLQLISTYRMHRALPPHPVCSPMAWCWGAGITLWTYCELWRVPKPSIQGLSM